MPWDASPALPELPVPESGSVTRITPMGQATKEGAVFVPLLQTVASGLGVLSFGYGVILCTKEIPSWAWPLVGVLLTTPLAGFGTFAYHNGLLKTVEKIVSELVPEQEEAEGKRIEINVTIDEVSANGRNHKLGECLLFSPASNRRGLFQYARAFLAGRAFFTYWGGVTAPGARKFGYTKGEFTELSANVKKAGLIEQEAERQPWKLTSRGEIIFKRIATRETEEMTLSPPAVVA